MRKCLVAAIFSTALFLGTACAADEFADLARGFAAPPPTARPWVYWTWIDGNINKAGITADLEAMKRVGIGGALILDVDQEMPHGPVRFFDKQWKDLFRYTVAEAKRLGLEINMNDGPGYYGSGGPWVPPEMGMQTVVASETHIAGGARWSGTLPVPSKRPEYADIAVVAVLERARSKYRIPDFEMKSLQWRAWIAYRGTRSAPLDAVAPAEAIIPLEGVMDLTGKMGADGSLTWDAPAGDWTILRLGHAWNGHIVGPSLRGETGPETDKLNKAATDLHFEAFVQQLNEIAGPDAKSALVATHIDSWEGGGQNWTGDMRDEFKKRRGYDPLPYLPILTGRVLGDLQTTERFLFDLRKTVSELTIENYTQEYQRLAHEAGLRNTFESYTTIANDLDNALYVDEPMAEFWTPNGQGLDFQPTIKSMSSAAHINGYSVVGAESFTSGASEKFRWTPSMIKSIGDVAFCGGINRFVFHRYAAQPFAEGVKPGMQMGPWGLHYERTNTWWEFSRPWHEYLARCQYLLRQGTFVADALQLTSEEPLLRFQETAIAGYDYDACGPETLLRGGMLGNEFRFPSGAHYRLILLPDSPSMSLPLITHIRDLVRGGAAILGNPPQRTPGLTDHERSDAELQAIAMELWGSDPAVTDRAVGQGRVFRHITPEAALAALGVAPDFTSDAGLHYIHRTLGNAELYFVASAKPEPVVATCTFRMANRQPQLWNPRTGAIVPLEAFAADGESTTLTLPLEPNGSAFILFTSDATAPGRHVLQVTRDNARLLDGGLLQHSAAEPEIDPVNRTLRQPGEYVFTFADGHTKTLSVSDAPAMTVAGPWQLRFPAGWGAPPQVTLDALISWSQHADAGIRYFSGTATYSKTLTLPLPVTGQHLVLDLGKVEVMARVRLNGQDLGILWKPPYRVDITSAVKAGENTLEIDVVNTWVNRLIGDEQRPEDSERNKNGTVKTWPQGLLEGKPSPAGRLTFSSWRLWKKSDPLQDSGLLGPVTLTTVQQYEP